MSALDQALIKAYDKPTPRAAAAPAAAPPARGGNQTTARVLPPANAAAIERIYYDGGLYRVDLPASATPGGPAAPQQASARSRSERTPLSAPHYELPPPTSPKRGMRRSILRLIANQQVPAASGSDVESPTPPRVQRKVIFRHISHGKAVPPHHLPILPEGQPAASGAAAESESMRTALQELQDIAPQIEVHGHWQEATTASPTLVIAPDADDPRTAFEQSFVQIQVDAFPEPQAADHSPARQHHDLEEPIDSDASAGAFVAKSLDDDHPARIRADHAHARGSHRPHVSFAAPKATEQPLAADEAKHERPLVDDVVLMDSTDLPELAALVEKQPSSRAAVPVWEVDRFHWPRNCEKLLADSAGYLAQAGDRLVAAVRDGLKTLAITGSRRGEGRTTLALCLARVAARAGIQVALLDADFARPTLATRLGLDVAHGWQDAALGHIPLSEAAVKSLADEITVLPLEVSLASRALTLADPRVTATLRAAAATFELVIIDLGPLGPGERIAFPPGEACPLDATIVVRDLRFASAAETQEVGERLYDAGIEAVGIAENFVTEEASVSAA